MTRPVEPGAWVDHAIQHGVAPFVADSVAAGGGVVPPALVEASRAQLQRGRRHRKFTLDVIGALNRRDVVPVLLKGYGLASRFYAQPLSRPASDVDVLVEPRLLAVCEQALEGLGLRFSPDPALADALEDHHHRAFVGPGGFVELHHATAMGFSLQGVDEEPLLRRAQPALLDGLQVRHLEAEDELLYLCAHAANHAFLRLSWLLDLKVVLARSPGLRWAMLADRAQQAGVARPALAALLLAERLVGAALPTAAREALGAGRSVRARLDPWVFDEESVATARWSNEKLPAVLLRLYLSQDVRQLGRQLFAGAQRAVRRARSRP